MISQAEGLLSPREKPRCRIGRGSRRLGEVRRGPYDETLLTPAVRVIGKINYTHRGGGDGGATASEIPPQSAAYLKSSRRRKLDSLSPALFHPLYRSPTSGVCVRVCACVHLCVHARARARIYIHVARRCRKTPSRSSDGTEVLHR